nr:H/ACA ribonucleoprotein complex non-core subunit NAF1 [Aedes albopictus]
MGAAEGIAADSKTPGEHKVEKVVKQKEANSDSCTQTEEESKVVTETDTTVRKESEKQGTDITPSKIAAVTIPSKADMRIVVNESAEPIVLKDGSTDAEMESSENFSGKASLGEPAPAVVPMESTEVDMASNTVVVPSVLDLQIASDGNGESLTQTVIKDEPTDAEMESAEDFTRKTSDFPTVPRITIKQEVPISMHEQVAAERALESKAVLQINSSSLSLLCQYISSDSDSNITDSDEEETRNGTNTIVAASSSSNSNNKRKVSSSSSSEDDVEIIPNTKEYRIQEGPIVVSDAETTATGMDESSEDELSAEEEEVPPQTRPPIKSKGEMLVNELPPIEDLQISVPEAQCKPIGHVESIVAQIVLVQSYAGVELLDLETVLFLDKGKRALGKIFDVIGQVTAPMYCVLFNTRNDVVRKGISVGMPVYCAPQTEHTSFIILSDLMKHKGSDASWLDDNEAPDHALDYSDDEQERNARGRRRRGSCSSSGRVSPDAMQYQPYHLPSMHYQPRRGGRGRGHRGGGPYRSRGHSWHTNLPYHQHPAEMQPPLRVLNPFAFVAGVPPPPPPPPPAPPGGSGN